MAQRRALITGITGQDGSYLAELLLEKGYDVFGMTRRASTENVDRIAHLVDRVNLVQGDLLDPPSLVSALRTAEPHEVYNLAAQSFVPTSWRQPVLTAEFTAIGVTRILEAVRAVDPEIRRGLARAALRAAGLSSLREVRRGMENRVRNR